jgi:hypothetical protein
MPPAYGSALPARFRSGFAPGAGQSKIGFLVRERLSSKNPS